jgi:hypothetical protein
MAALGHLGVGLAAKRFAPEVPVGYLILGAYALDVVWFACFGLGLEPLPKPGQPEVLPVWSHSLTMALVWSALGALIAWRVWRTARAAVVCGLVVFSHWVVDWITHPMSAVAPGDTGLPLWFSGRPLVGLGMYRTMTGVYLGEFGGLALGILVYVLARRKFTRAEAHAGAA